MLFWSTKSVGQCSNVSCTLIGKEPVQKPYHKSSTPFPVSSHIAEISIITILPRVHKSLSQVIVAELGSQRAELLPTSPVLDGWILRVRMKMPITEMLLVSTPSIPYSNTGNPRPAHQNPMWIAYYSWNRKSGRQGAICRIKAFKYGHKFRLIYHPYPFGPVWVCVSEFGSVHVPTGRAEWKRCDPGDHRRFLNHVKLCGTRVARLWVLSPRETVTKNLFNEMSDNVDSSPTFNNHHEDRKSARNLLHQSNAVFYLVGRMNLRNESFQKRETQFIN